MPSKPSPSPTTGTATAPRVLVLGPVAVRNEEGVVRVLSGQQAEVLSLLASAAPDPVRVDSLIDALWGVEAPRTAATGLRVVITRLRDKLTTSGDDPILAEGGHYRLTVGLDQVDHCLFTAEVVHARQQLAFDPAQAASRLRTALSLWRGEAFQPHADHEVIGPHAARLGQEKAEADELLIEALLESGQIDEAVARATDLVADDALRERRWFLLMLGLYRAGRQAEALRTYQRAARLFDEELGLEPGPALRDLERDILAHDPKLLPPTEAGPLSNGIESLVTALRSDSNPAPAPASPMLGRDQELDTLSDLMHTHRLVTLVGPPGVGKTRLATQVAGSQDDRRVLWLDLAILQPETIVGELAAQLGVLPDLDSVIADVAAALRQEKALVVMDNCEHVIEAAVPLAESLIRACPELRVLVTSRQLLDSSLETRFEVDPLPRVDARRLLLDRAFGRNHRPPLDEGELQALLEQLDRLPLAIELAAGLLRTRTPGDVVRDLERTASVLTRSRTAGNDRHQSLIAALEWSSNLLDEGDRSSFIELGAMHGPFHRTDVARVLDTSDDEATDLLGRLADQSLVTAERDRPAGEYRLLETVRTYARDRLLAEGRLDLSRRRHAYGYQSLLQWAEPRWRGSDEERAVGRVGAAGPQLRAAFSWGLENQDADLTISMATSIWDHALLRMNHDQQGWSEEVLASFDTQEHPDHHALLGVAAMSSWARGDFDRSLARADAACLAAEARDAVVPASALRARMNVAGSRLDPVLGEQAAVAMLEHSRVHADAWEHSAVLGTIALGWSYIGDHGLSAATSTKALELAQRTENASAIAWAVYSQGFAALDSDPAAAMSLFLEGIRLAGTVRNRWVQGMATAGSVTARRRLGEFGDAAMLLSDLIPHWQRGGVNTLLGNSCREAVLVLAGLERPDLAAAALRASRTTGHPQPLLPPDEERLRELADEFGTSVDVGSLEGPGRSVAGPSNTVSEEAALLVSRLLQQAVVDSDT